MAEVLQVLVDGGKASAGPPLGPALGPLGVNVVNIVKAVNEKTKAFTGMKVPVKLTINTKTKDFEVEVGTPPASALILKELGIEKGSGSARTHKAGNLTIENIKKVAQMKESSLTGVDVKARVKEIAGTCVSMGINVDGKDAKVFLEAAGKGEYDGQLQ